MNTISARRKRQPRADDRIRHLEQLLAMEEDAHALTKSVLRDAQLQIERITELLSRQASELVAKDQEILFLRDQLERG